PGTHPACWPPGPSEGPPPDPVEPRSTPCCTVAARLSARSADRGRRILHGAGPSEGQLVAPSGSPPATIKSVYSLSKSSTAGAGRTIAIVDAYDLPTAETDLNTFSSAFGLPACSSERVLQEGR